MAQLLTQFLIMSGIQVTQPIWQTTGWKYWSAIARFWAQRVNFSALQGKYMILGVTGPNEYENNVNNNWYTNTIAAWCLKYTRKIAETLRVEAPGKYADLANRISLSDDEMTQWSRYC